jgi:hypothetical protein
MKPLYLLVLAAFYAVHCAQSETNNEATDLLLLGAASQAAACAAAESKTQASRQFQSGFENIADFNGFYITPLNYQNAATHELTGTQSVSGQSHRAYIYAAGPACPAWQNCNHRAYPTVQLQKTAAGAYRTPVEVELSVRLNMSLASGQWVSFVTLTSDPSDAWARTLLLNLGYINGTGGQPYVHLFHLPNQGQGGWSYQISDANNPLPFPQNQWVTLKVCVDWSSTGGFARAYQNGTLVSAGPLSGGCGLVQQAHFGLYAQPTLTSGEVFNDNLTIREVASCN